MHAQYISKDERQEERKIIAEEGNEKRVLNVRCAPIVQKVLIRGYVTRVRSCITTIIHEHKGHISNDSKFCQISISSSDGILMKILHWSLLLFIFVKKKK